MDTKKQKELVFKVVWRSFLGVILILALFNTFYFGLTDTLVHANFATMIAISSAPAILGVGAFVYGMYFAVSVFLKDIKNYIEDEVFAWCFLIPLGKSIASVFFGFAALFLAAVFFASSELLPTAVPSTFAFIELCFEVVPQMYAVAYILSVVFAGAFLVHRKFI